MCEGTNVTTLREPDVIHYGEPGPQQAEIHLTVTVRHCGDCNRSWLDDIVQSEQDAAVARFLAGQPYRCEDCGWKGSKPNRPRFGLVTCPTCGELVSVVHDVM